MPEQATADIVVIGAGMAGTSAAAELAETHRVILLERESRPAMHSTGRSAAVYEPGYGPTTIRALTRASGAFLEAGGAVPFLRPRGVMLIAREDQIESLEAAAAKLGPATVRRCEAAELRARVPLLREGYAAAALYGERAADMDVDALHQHFLRRFRAAGGELYTGAEVTGLSRAGAGWRIETTAGSFGADTVVNAAGAWADAVAALAGVAGIGLVPKRRTAALIAAPDGVATTGWPVVIDIDEQFYMKPDAGQLLISPADATPSPPCDAQPEELDLAIAVDRIERAFDISVRRIAHKWAGLRSFVADGEPVAGYAPDAPGFFWLAAQGGYGIQTSPALARVAAALVRGEELPPEAVAEGVTAAALAPGRLAAA